jgi:hypothetical protein
MFKHLKTKLCYKTFCIFERSFYKWFLVPQLYCFLFFLQTYLFLFFFLALDDSSGDNKVREKKRVIKQTIYFFLADQKETKLSCFYQLWSARSRTTSREMPKKMNSPVPFDLCDADWRTWRKINWGKKFARQCFSQAKVLKLLLF